MIYTYKYIYIYMTVKKPLHRAPLQTTLKGVTLRQHEQNAPSKHPPKNLPEGPPLEVLNRSQSRPPKAINYGWTLAWPQAWAQAWGWPWARAGHGPGRGHEACENGHGHGRGRGAWDWAWAGAWAEHTGVGHGHGRAHGIGIGTWASGSMSSVPRGALYHGMADPPPQVG